ncbi:hypothetical protein Tco_0566843 [Tanacetum coccineum]
MDHGVFDDDTVFRRFELKHKLLNVSEMESKDNFQKSKVKWAVEGDENSKFFHGIINKRRAQLAIRGIFVDGFWETEPGPNAQSVMDGNFRNDFSPIMDWECIQVLPRHAKCFIACSLSHTDYKVEALVQKLIDEDKVHQNAILDLALQFENACIAKDDLRKAYEKCNDIPQESRALIDTFIKEGSDKDYELNLSMYGKAAKLEKQMNAKLACLLKKYNYRSQTHIGCSSSQADLYLTEKEIHQLHLDEEALRETLEEKVMDKKTREEKIRQKQADDDEFFMELGW